MYHDVTSGNNSVPGVTGFTAGIGLRSGDADSDRRTDFCLVQHWNDTTSTNSERESGVLQPGA